MLVFSKKERSWQSSYAIRKVASHPSPFLGFRRQTCTAAQMGTHLPPFTNIVVLPESFPTVADLCSVG